MLYNKYFTVFTFYGFWVVFGLLLMGGCEKFVTVDLPESQLTGSTVFEDENTATAALIQVYSSIRDEGLFAGTQMGCTFLLGIYSDELVLYSNNMEQTEFYHHTVQSNNRDVQTMWELTYQQVYRLNAILEGIGNSVNLSNEVKDQLTGEALFLRGLIYFQATNIWGDIPYVTTTDYRANSQIGRDNKEWVLEQISTDLDVATSLLPDGYPSNDRTRANRYVVMTLQSRLALYQKNWEQVVARTSDILEATTEYQWEEDLNQVFKIESPSTIWQLQAGVSGRNTREASMFIINSIPPTISAFSETLNNSFEAGDQRQIQWIGSIVDEDNGNVYYYPYKYSAPFIGASTVEYSKVFRLAEVYLMRAEAYVHLGNLSSALNDLNKVRTRAGLDTLELVDSDMVLAAIVQERRHELFTEYGHRWFDLARLGLANEIISTVKDGWKDTDLLFPIPEKELITNPNLLPQNNGY